MTSVIKLIFQMNNYKNNGKKTLLFLRSLRNLESSCQSSE